MFNQYPLVRMNERNFMEECDSFWKNYAAAMKWQKDFITNRSISHNQYIQPPLPEAHSGSQVDETIADDDDDDDDDSSMEIEVSDEYMEYLRSKVQRQNKIIAEPQEEEKQEDNSTVQLSSEFSRKQKLEMLYGESASVISAMEFAMELCFEHFSPKEKVVLWPVLPLKFK